MLLTLIEKADFLVEDDLNALMAVLPDKDKLLLKVDSILGALGVKEESDIEKIFDNLTLNFLLRNDAILNQLHLLKMMKYVMH